MPGRPWPLPRAGPRLAWEIWPAPGKDRVLWLDHDVRQMTLRPGDSVGMFIAEGTGLAGEGSFSQRWAAGGLCAECGSRGPRGTHPCSDPVLRCPP